MLCFGSVEILVTGLIGMALALEWIWLDFVSYTITLLTILNYRKAYSIEWKFVPDRPLCTTKSKLKTVVL